MAHRYRGWESGWLMVRDAPWTGIGYGHETIRRAYPEYGRRTGDVERKPHLHNVPLEYAAESGMPAAIFFLAWCVLRWGSIARAFGRAGDAGARDWMAGWIALEAALFMMCFLDFYLRRPFGLLTWGAWAYALSEAEGAGGTGDEDGTGRTHART
jgi:O-antigen ligase